MASVRWIRKNGIDSDNSLIDLQFPGRVFHRLIRPTTAEEIGALRARQRRALMFVQSTSRLADKRLVSICALRRRTRPLSLAERKAIRRRQRAEQAVSQAIDTLDDLTSLTRDELRLLAVNPDVSPFVSLCAEHALQSRG